jgi:ribosomal protein S18 acetylase RimI-like enzyme
LWKHPVPVSERFVSALFLGGELAGTAPNATLLSSLAVHPAYTGKGIGVALVERFCRQAEARRSGYVYLTTDQNHNDRINAFYRKCGFGIESSSRRKNGRVMNRYRRPLPTVTTSGA